MSESLKDLPKISNPLAKELLESHHLRHTETEEKVVLPTPEQIAREKTEQSLLSEITESVALKKTETNEKNVLPTAEEILLEKSLK